MSQFELVTVQSGARSLRSREFGETFHPVVGPMAEAQALHVRQQRLVERALAAAEPLIVWDVGLGAAANALAALGALGELPRIRAEIHSFDHSLDPLRFALEHAEELAYLAPFRQTVEALLAQGRARFQGVNWIFHLGDFVQTAPECPAPHALLYDPYSPATNPEMWTCEHFTRLFARLDPARGCLLSNYTRSTAVRVSLLLAGFFVGRGGATGEKEETTVAGNQWALLEQPLDGAWLERVARSTRGAPLRLGVPGGPVSAPDLAALRAHPQFNR